MSDHMQKRVAAIRRAAVAFANDYGPLPAANNGDQEAQQEVAKRLFDRLIAEGLHIVMPSVDANHAGVEKYDGIN